MDPLFGAYRRCQEPGCVTGRGGCHATVGAEGPLDVHDGETTRRGAGLLEFRVYITYPEILMLWVVVTEMVSSGSGGVGS